MEIGVMEVYLPPGYSKDTKYPVFYLLHRDEDRLMDATRTFHSSLEQKKVPHDWHIDSGAHTWPVWKNDLCRRSLRPHGATASLWFDLS